MPIPLYRRQLTLEDPSIGYVSLVEIQWSFEPMEGSSRPLADGLSIVWGSAIRPHGWLDGPNLRLVAHPAGPRMLWSNRTFGMPACWFGILSQNDGLAGYGLRFLEHGSEDREAHPSDSPRFVVAFGTARYPGRSYAIPGPSLASSNDPGRVQTWPSVEAARVWLNEHGLDEGSPIPLGTGDFFAEIRSWDPAMPSTTPAGVAFDLRTSTVPTLADPSPLPRPQPRCEGIVQMCLNFA